MGTATHASHPQASSSSLAVLAAATPALLAEPFGQGTSSPAASRTAPASAAHSANSRRALGALAAYRTQAVWPEKTGVCDPNPASNSSRAQPVDPEHLVRGLGQLRATAPRRRRGRASRRRRARRKGGRRPAGGRRPRRPGRRGPGRRRRRRGRRRRRRGGAAPPRSRRGRPPSSSSLFGRNAALPVLRQGSHGIRGGEQGLELRRRERRRGSRGRGRRRVRPGRRVRRRRRAESRREPKKQIRRRRRRPKPPALPAAR